METPLSSRRVTRSQTLAASNNSSKIPISRLIEESEKSMTKSRQRNQQQQQQQERSALIDITNDSPIVGLATRGLGAEAAATTTPASSMAKQKSNVAKQATPGSGEALLRGQVKTLLQKVEEEAVVSSKPGGGPFLQLKGFVHSPAGLLAPTPANTPCLAHLCSSVGSTSVAPAVASCHVVQEKLNIIPQVVIGEVVDGKKQEEASLESQRSVINRSLLLDFSEKSEHFDLSDCSSVVTDQEMVTDDDSGSAWSTQVNASARDDDEEEGIDQEQGDYYEEEDDSELMIDELCEGMKKLNVVKFMGRHTRFVYNSDGEIVGEEDVCADDESEDNATTGKEARLRIWPTPEGKHLRFSDGDDVEGRVDEESEDNLTIRKEGRLRVWPLPEGKHLRFPDGE